MGRVFIFGAAGLTALGLLFIAAVGGVTVYRWATRRHRPTPPLRSTLDLLGRAGALLASMSSDLSGSTILSQLHRTSVEKWLIDYEKEFNNHAQ